MPVSPEAPLTKHAFPAGLQQPWGHLMSLLYGAFCLEMLSQQHLCLLVTLHIHASALYDSRF